MVGKRSCMARSARKSTVPSPTPASNRLTAGGRGWMLASSSDTRFAITHFSLQVLTNSRYFCRLSKKRKLRCGSSAAGLGAAGRGTGAMTGAILAAFLGHEGANAVERIGRDAAAVAQAAGELAVVDGAPAEGRLGEPGLATEIGDFSQDGVVHGRPDVSASTLDRGFAPTLWVDMATKANQAAGSSSTT